VKKSASVFWRSFFVRPYIGHAAIGLGLIYAKNSHRSNALNGYFRLAADLELSEQSDRRSRNRPFTFDKRIGLLYIRSRSFRDNPSPN